MANNPLQNNVPPITIAIIPVSKLDKNDMSIVAKSVRESVFHLETLMKMRYYPVPTLIFDELESLEIENSSKCDVAKNIHLFGEYFHPKQIFSQEKDLIKIKEKRMNEMRKKLFAMKYSDTFIDYIFSGGFVALCYERCKKVADIKNDIITAVLIHAHAHAITFEGRDENGYNELYKSVVCLDKTDCDSIELWESIAEWASISYFRANPIIYKILTEHAAKSDISIWPYNVAWVKEKQQKAQITKEHISAWPYAGALLFEEDYKENDKKDFFARYEIVRGKIDKLKHVEYIASLQNIEV